MWELWVTKAPSIFKSPNFASLSVNIVRGLIRKTYPTWNKIYRVSFSIIVNKLPHAQWTNVIHFTTGGDHKVYGERVPAVWINKGGQSFHICSAVPGNGNLA